MSLYRIKIKLNQISVWTDLLLRYLFPYDLKILVVTGFPKSGTTWICQLLAESTGYYFNNKPRLPHLRKVIVHCHRSVGFLLAGFGNRSNLVYVVRDPRDVLLSAYHSIITSAERVESPNQLPSQIKELYLYLSTFNDEKERIHRFCERFIVKYPGSPLNWHAHVSQAIRNNVVIVRYEDLKTQPTAELKNLLNNLNLSCTKDLSKVIDKYSFKKQKEMNQNIKEISGYYRQGESGVFKHEMARETSTMIYNQFKDVMQQLGYENS